MNRAWFAAIFLLLGSSFFLSAGAAQSTLKEHGLKVDAYDLAQRYFDAKWLIEQAFPMVEKGWTTVTIKHGKIDKKKARKLKKEYRKELSTYGQAITERGYKTIAGSYQAKTSESCGRIRSSWVNPIHAGITSDVEIQQNAYEARLIVRVEYEGEEVILENPAVVIESAFFVRDAEEYDYFFRGEIKGEDIVLKPDLSVLVGWQKRFLPPHEQDMRNCTITLEPRTGAGATQSTLTGRVVKVDEYDGATQSSLSGRVVKVDDEYDLAQRYLKAKGMMAAIQYRKISKKKARKLKKEYRKELSTYGQAITERGYKSIAGSYQAKTSESCGRIGWSWVNSIHLGITSDVEIQQDAYEARLIVRFEYQGEKVILESSVIVVENIVGMRETSGFSGFFRGEIKGEDIVIKPDVSTLVGRPPWPVPPREQDLRNCTITLEPRKGNPGD